MFNKILVAFDNGEQAKRALDMAIEMAEIYKSKISIVTTINLSSYNLTFSEVSVIKSIDDETRNRIVGAMEEVAERARKDGIEVKTEVLSGVPGETIVKYIEKEKIDLAIMGSSNRSSINKMFLGSVSSYVVQNAPCKVMVIK
ncbi:MAG: putative universal stress protein [Pelotomaculum sp. PtaB.Bin104]|nr:MAG: putative universal stress protein [Pelotomaculum sp. PtaB.Bin104]